MGHEFKRRWRINQIKGIFLTAKKEKVEINEDLLIMELMSDWSCSYRIMLEYIKVAKHEIRKQRLEASEGTSGKPDKTASNRAGSKPNNPKLS